MIYLDANAGVRPDKIAVTYAAELICAADGFANPSSTHEAGGSAKKHLEAARSTLASSLGCKSEEVIFTSGGTEANSLALHGNPEAGCLVICPSIEHSSVFNCAVEKTGVLPDGTYELNNLEDCLKKLRLWSGRKIISTSIANAETGVLQPTGEIRELASRYGARFHCDLIAGYGKYGVETNVLKLGCDTASISGAKIGAPAGIGALYIKEGTDVLPMMTGQHERGWRAGTENKFGAICLGMVVDFWKKRPPEDLSPLRNKLESLLVDISNINGTNRVCNTSNLFFPAVKDLDVFLDLLNQQGLMCSGKSACASGMPGPSRVIESMFGKDSPQTQASVRFSFSKENTEEEIERAAEIIRIAIGQMARLE